MALRKSTIRTSFREAYERLAQWMIQADFSGHDPYDGNATQWELARRFYIGRLGLTYLNKFSPVNWRRFLRIPKYRNNQTVAFVLRAAAKFPFSSRESTGLLEGEVRWLLNRSQTPGPGWLAWHGLDFPVQMRVPRSMRGAEEPDVIATEACARVLIECGDWLPAGFDRLGALRSVADYLIEEHHVDSSRGAWFRYFADDGDETVTYNATALAAALVAEIGALTGWEEADRVAARCFEFLLDRQRPEGHWPYRERIVGGGAKEQIDFHQGFILDSLLSYMELRGLSEPWLGAFRRGLAFYREQQFLDSGQGIYRYPRKWPVNIQNQAQGIVTFSRAARLDRGNYRFARTIADWTMKRMQDPAGYFYYIRYPMLPYKIPYMRWSDSGMLYALAHILSAGQETTANGKHPAVDYQHNY